MVSVAAQTARRPASRHPGIRCNLSLMRSLHIIRRGQTVALAHIPPDSTLLQLLREDLGHTGTKEGCGEGDCGACTVVVGEAEGGRVRYRAINACIALAHSIDGKALWTAEDLAQDPLLRPLDAATPPGGLHPVQQALVQHHGSQCGFCPPGFVMSLFARGREDAPPPVADSIAGNLCRCTGYGPIMAGAEAAAATALVEDDPVDALKILAKDEQIAFEWNGRHWFSPDRK